MQVLGVALYSHSQSSSATSTFSNASSGCNFHSSMYCDDTWYRGRLWIRAAARAARFHRVVNDWAGAWSAAWYVDDDGASVITFCCLGEGDLKGLMGVSVVDCPLPYFAASDDARRV